ncbi:hypothetical protein OTU49_003795, partial [Cherax quadricarinatus]
QVHHCFVPGKKYKKLQDLEINTATKIQVPNTNQNSEDIIIMATRQSMEKAMHHTQQITEQRCHRVSSQQSSTNTPAFWDPQDKLRQGSVSTSLEGMAQTSVAFVMTLEFHST